MKDARITMKSIFLTLGHKVFYFMLSYISCSFQVDIISELSNWLFLVLFPLLIIAVFRKEKIIQTLKESGLRHFDRKTVLRILLICAAYQGVIILVFGLGGFCFIFLQGHSAKNYDGFTKKAISGYTAYRHSVWVVPFSVCILSMGQYGREHYKFTQNGYDGTCSYWLRLWLSLL